MTRAVTIAGHRFDLNSQAIEEAAGRALPEPVRDHFVVIKGRRFPPKQVLSLATGLDRADFTTHQARRTLMRLGFPASRRSAPSASHQHGGPGRRSATEETDALLPFVGQWVAVRDHEVLVAADSAGEVVAWLSRHGQVADSMFRVPETEAAAGGVAPL